jgi:hypothetical protein
MPQPSPISAVVALATMAKSAKGEGVFWTFYEIIKMETVYEVIKNIYKIFIGLRCKKV